MAGEYWDAILWKKRGERNFPLRIGSALKKDDGTFVVFLDALPVPNPDGSLSISIMPPRERGEGKRTGWSKGAAKGDDPPF